MTAAASAWLETLDADQRAAGRYPSPLVEEANAERLRWYYTPTDHGGLALREQAARQQSLAMQLVATGLSQPGYVTVCVVMGLDNVLDQVEGWTVDWGRERGRDPSLYWLRIFGNPGDPIWAWRFGGHHISLNYLIVDSLLASTTPCFIGADPASSALLGRDTLRPLGPTEDLARDLMRSLDEHSRAQALLHPRAISDIVSGNRPRVTDGDQMIHMQDLWRGRFTSERLADRVEDIDVTAETGSRYTARDHADLALTAQPKGVAAAGFNADQRAVLRLLMGAYFGRAPEELGNAYAALYTEESALNRVHFGWAGSVDPGQPLYYRLQAPNLLAEYDNTQRNANHAHSVWRDPSSDFGLDALALRQQARRR